MKEYILPRGMRNPKRDTVSLDAISEFELNNIKNEMTPTEQILYDSLGEGEEDEEEGLKELNFDR